MADPELLYDMFLHFRVFVEQALKDVERYKRQKTRDLKDIFTNYCILQIERCKKVCVKKREKK